MAVTDLAGKQLNIELAEYGELTWVNIEKPSVAEMSYLKEHYPFHPLDLDDCLSRVQLPKLDEYPGYLFLVMHFPLFKEAMRLTQPSQVSIFVGATYVVTVHTGELRPLTKLFRDCQSSEAIREETMGSGSGLLLYRILDGLVDYCFPILNRVMENVDRVEEGIFDRREGQILRELALLRRDILSYRRIVHPQIDVLESMEEKEFPFLKVNPEVYFGDLADHMRRLWAELEDLKEVVEGLHDTHDSLSSQHTNQIMRVLTIFATIMLPLTVVASLYGMNVSLPLQDNVAAFGIVVAIMALISAGLLSLFRVRRWL